MKYVMLLLRQIFYLQIQLYVKGPGEIFVNKMEAFQSDLKMISCFLFQCQEAIFTSFYEVLACT